MKDTARIEAEFEQYKKDAEARIALLEADIRILKGEAPPPAPEEPKQEA